MGSNEGGDEMSKDSRLLELAAAILLNKEIDIYTVEQSENASEILEVVIRRHYADGRKS